MKLHPAVLAVALSGLISPAIADVYCPPHLGAVTVDDNVIVTGTCVLSGTQVKGNVLVKSGGALTLRDARIEGNLQADGGRYVRVNRTNIGGDIGVRGAMEQPTGLAASKHFS